MHYVIIGNGVAGITAAETIRDSDKKGRITIITNEHYNSYFRPALTKYLKGDLDEESLLLKPIKFYEKQNIGVINKNVTKVIPETNQVVLEGTGLVKYDKLLIATGASPIMDTWPGAELNGVHTLRNMNDAKNIMTKARIHRRVVIIGAGILALQVAEAMYKLGNRVTLLVRENQIGIPVLDTCVSRKLFTRMTDAGIDIRLNEAAKEFRGKDGEVIEVKSTKGKIYKTNLVVVAIGVRPNISFLNGSGISIDEGIIVDDKLKTNHQNIYAAGDCVQFKDTKFFQYEDRRSWFPAAKMGQIAGQNMLEGNLSFNPGIFSNFTSFFGLPYVFMGDFNPKLSLKERKQYRLIHLGCKIGDKHKAVVLKDGRIIGASFYGDRTNAEVFKKLIDKQMNVDLIATRLFDPMLDLKSLLIEKKPEPEEKEPSSLPNAFE
ncbi:FAD-dependent oxidoreductase [Candidatus Woesearchaeota archaeon]|nr:FAD-dependent oxidoreductase [Candidatus Woesearchaeota archaeon]